MCGYVTLRQQHVLLFFFKFLRILETRARATDVLPGAMPQDTVVKAQLPPNAYYEVLYAFHIRRANFREAAMTMFEYAYRLAEETACAISAGGFRAVGGLLLHGLQRQASCLLAAINALYVVPTDHQWLVRPGMDSLDIRSNEVCISLIRTLFYFRTCICCFEKSQNYS